jgi:hypothetical protein
VALTDDDPANCGTPLVPKACDITTSIGKRIGSSGGEIMGYAGREAATAGLGTKPLGINTIKPADDRVRDSTYLLARRLFIQNSFVNSFGNADVPTDDQTNNAVTGAGALQLTAEQDFWNGFLTNRAVMDPIVRNANFIRCSYTADGLDPALESNNLCSTEPAAPTPSAFGAYLPSGAVTGNNGGAKAIAYDGRVPTAYAPTTAVTRTSGWQNGRLCTATLPCTCSATTPCLDLPLVAVTNAATATSAALCVTGGNAPASGGACPAPAARPENAPCSVNAECGAGLICRDVFGHGVPGELHGLYCCNSATNAACLP